MSTSIDKSFVRQYEAEVHHEFQKRGAILRPTVRTANDVTGESTTFQKIGRGMATTKSRHGKVTPMNQDHTPITCPIVDFYAGDWSDKLDEAKIRHDERMAIAEGGAWALGRKVDDQILTVMSGTTQTAIPLAVTSSAEARNALLKASQALDGNDVPNDGRRYGALTPYVWAVANTIKEFASADYVGANGVPLQDGAPVNGFKRWNGVLWTVHTGTPGAGTATAESFVYHMTAVGHATGAHAGNVAQNQQVAADITWNGPEVSWFVNHMMSGGACMIDDPGVIKITSDDTGNLPTT